MGIFSWIKKEVRDTQPAGVEQKNFGSTSILNTYQNRGTKSTISKSERESTYRGWIYGLINLISNNVSETPMRVFTTTDDANSKIANFKSIPVDFCKRKQLESKAIASSIRGSAQIEELPTHPSIQLLKTVNSYQDGFGLVYLTNTWVDLYGDAYWYVSKDADNVPEEIHILDPKRVAVLVNKTMTEVQGYAYKRKLQGGSEDMITFAPDEIVHFSNPSITNRFMGDSPLAALATPVKKLGLSNRLETSVLDNNGMPLVLLKSDSVLTPEQIRSVEMQFMKSTGGGRQGGVKVLDSRLEFEQVQYSLKDLMLTDLQVFDIKQISFAYGVPYAYLDTSDQKKAGLDDMERLFAKNCLIPRLTRFEEALNQQYATMWGEQGDLLFAFDSVLQANEEETIDGVIKLLGAGIITDEEARLILGIGD